MRQLNSKKVFWPCLSLLIVGIGILAGFQNAGNTGTATTAQQVFTAAAAPATSAVVRNVGQSAHYLSYCVDAGVTALQIAIEGSYDGTTYYPISVIAGVPPNPALTKCSVLEAGGYQQNVRAAIYAITGGTVTAWYSASSGPIESTNAGVSSSGAASPTVCDASKSVQVANAATATLVPAVTNLRVVVCGYSVTTTGTTGGPSVQFQSAVTCAGGSTVIWAMAVTANTQIYQMGSGFGTLFPTAYGQGLCFTNTSGGATAYVDVSYAQL